MESTASVAETESGEFLAPSRLMRGRRPSERRYRMTAAEYRDELCEEERSAVRLAFELSLLDFVEQNRAVELEGFGVLFPVTRELTRPLYSGEMMTLRRNLVRTVQFEKCDDSSLLCGERFAARATTTELAQEVKRRLPAALAWEVHQVARILRGHIQLIREDVIVSGVSTPFDSLGTFLCLHNRQGQSPRDWFAGADIFIDAHYERILKSETVGTYPLPIFRDPWEPLECSFGERVPLPPIDLAQKLRSLGSDDALLRKAENVSFEMAAFISEEQPNIWTICTNGFRCFDSEAACELVVQCSRDVAAGEETPPEWTRDMIALAWVLTQTSRSRGLRIGDGLSAGAPLDGNSTSTLDTIFVAPFRPLPSRYGTAEGPFSYRSLIGISSDEGLIAKRCSPQHLLALLKLKGLSQFTRPERPSLLQRSVFEPANRSAVPQRPVTSGYSSAST